MATYKPRIIPDFVHFDSFLWICLKYFLNQTFAFLWYKWLFWKTVFSLTNCMDYVRWRCSIKRKYAINHIKKNNTASPYINWGTVTFLFGWKYLRSHVFESSSIKIGIELISYTTDSKICNFDQLFLMRLDEYIFYFEISMNNILPMTVTDCTDDLFEVIFSLLFGNTFALLK